MMLSTLESFIEHRPLIHLTRQGLRKGMISGYRMAWGATVSMEARFQHEVGSD